MSGRIISALIVLLLLTSVVIPVASTGEPSQVYYELHDMCLMNAHEDLGKIPYLTYGIGYEADINDEQSDKWVIFIHAGTATKKIIITPETHISKLMAVRDFVNEVDKCKFESDQLSIDLAESLTTGLAGSYGVVKGALTDDGLSTILGASGIVYSIEEVHQYCILIPRRMHKHMQKNFGEVFE